MATDRTPHDRQQSADSTSAGLWLAVLGFGALVNLLILTGPVFMVQVYDRVLPSGSGATLAVLFALVAFVYAMMALIDAARARLLLRLAVRLRTATEGDVMAARMRAQAGDPPDPRAASLLDDLDAVHRAMTSPALLALLDTPWSFAFLGLLFLFHPAMGLVAIAGGLVLILIALAGHWRQHGPRSRAVQAARRSTDLARVMSDSADDIAATGLAPGLLHRWRGQRQAALGDAVLAADRAAFDSAAARTFRLFMQSAMLALGAWLALEGGVSPGLIVAASILMGRALAPIEVLAAQWSLLWGARQGWHRLHDVVHAYPPTTENRSPVDGGLRVQGLVIAVPGIAAPVLSLAGFAVPQGRALGVIGPGGSGKTLLARALAGTIPLAAGSARLGDTVLPCRGVAGYLSQRARLYPGTVADNIARFDPAADLSEVIAAARLAGAHEAVMALPEGYGTDLTPWRARIAAGLEMRLCLARAFYAAPPLVILDEPGAQLDAEGVATLNAAIRALKDRGAVVIVLSHRPAAISVCEDLLVLEHGRQVAFGPRERVLREVVRNHTAIVPQTGGGAG